MTLPSATAHEVQELEDADVAGAVYRATALNRSFPECASLLGERSDRRERECEAAQALYRENFRVAVEACNEGGTIPGQTTEIPTSYTCTISIRETATSPVVGRAAIIYNAGGQWNAYLIGRDGLLAID